MRGVRTRIPQAIDPGPLRRARAAREAARLFRPIWRVYVQRLVGPAALVAAEVVPFVYQRATAPAGFPGFDAIEVQWENDHGSTRVPGNYYEAFAGGTYGPLVDYLFDHSDTIPFTFNRRYWGHFHTAAAAGINPVTTPGVMADDWPVASYVVPGVAPQASPVSRPADLARVTAIQPLNASNIWIEATATSARMGLNAKPKRPEKGVREGKTSRMGAAAVAAWRVIAEVTEALDFLEILAVASHYHPDSMIIPENIPRDSPQAKLWWLFMAGGLNHVDWGTFAEAFIDNEIEDQIYGRLGRLSGQAARGLDLTVGPQTGLAL